MEKFIIFISICIAFCRCSNKTDVDSSLTAYVKTLEITDITSTSAICSGKVEILTEQNLPPATSNSSIHNNYIIESGVCYASGAYPNIGDNKVVGERKSGIATISNPRIGEFSASLKKLKPGSSYYVRSYTITSVGTFYGNVLNFSTKKEDEVPEPEKPEYIELPAAGIAVHSTDITGSTTSFNSATNLCENSITGDYTDWRLPTIGELNTLYTTREIIGGFSYSSNYWSSSKDENYYFMVYFYNGTTLNSRYYTEARCRCVRSI